MDLVFFLFLLLRIVFHHKIWYNFFLYLLISWYRHGLNALIGVVTIFVILVTFNIKIEASWHNPFGWDESFYRHLEFTEHNNDNTECGKIKNSIAIDSIQEATNEVSTWRDSREKCTRSHSLDGTCEKCANERNCWGHGVAFAYGES